MNIAIVGATGLVGKTFLQVLDERNINIDNLYLFAGRSAGIDIDFKGRRYKVYSLDEGFIKTLKLDFIFFSGSNEVSKKYADLFSKIGIVIDNSSYFRMKKDVPLVIPQINGEDAIGSKLIANPNCSTIVMLLAIYPIYRNYKINEIVVSTYQSVSGAGKLALQDLFQQTKAIIEDKKEEIQLNSFNHQIAFNLINYISDLQNNNFCKEEEKMINETKKILKDKIIKVFPTTVRVPTLFGHGESIFLKLDDKVDIKEVKSLYKNLDYVVYKEDYIGPIDVEKTDKVYVSRLRVVDNNILLWAIGNNLRIGAASNAINIMEYILKNK